MKKIFAILTVTVVVFMSFFGCSAKEEKQTTVTTTTTTQPTMVKTTAKPKYKINFKSLPDIEKYNAFQNKYFYEDGASDNFVPRNDYGYIIPYKAYGEYYDPTDGFTTTDGKIITKPVYNYIELYTHQSKSLYLCTRYYYSPEHPEESQVVISADGKWIHKNIKSAGYGIFLTNDLEIYDFDNNYVCSVEGMEETLKNSSVREVRRFASKICFSNERHTFIYDTETGEQTDIIDPEWNYTKEFCILSTDKIELYDKNLDKCSSDKYSNMLKNCKILKYDEKNKIFVALKNGNISFFKKDGTPVNQSRPVNDSERSSLSSISILYGKKSVSAVFYGDSFDWIDVKSGKCMIENEQLLKSCDTLDIYNNYVIIISSEQAYIYDADGNIIKTLDARFRDIYKDFYSYSNSICTSNNDISVSYFDQNDKNILNICYNNFKKSKKININECGIDTDYLAVSDGSIVNYICQTERNYICETIDCDTFELLIFIDSGKCYHVAPNTLQKYTLGGKTLYSFTTNLQFYLIDTKGNIIMQKNLYSDI